MGYGDIGCFGSKLHRTPIFAKGLNSQEISIAEILKGADLPLLQIPYNALIGVLMGLSACTPKADVESKDNKPKVITALENSDYGFHLGEKERYAKRSQWEDGARTPMIIVGPGNYAIISNGYRFIQYNDGSEEFYVHANDPHEWNNVVEDPEYADLVTRHREHVPQVRHEILGKGSTGHLSYSASEANRKLEKQ